MVFVSYPHASYAKPGGLDLIGGIVRARSRAALDAVRAFNKVFRPELGEGASFDMLQCPLNKESAGQATASQIGISRFDFGSGVHHKRAVRDHRLIDHGAGVDQEPRRLGRVQRERRVG